MALPFGHPKDTPAEVAPCPKSGRCRGRRVDVLIAVAVLTTAVFGVIRGHEVKKRDLHAKLGLRRQDVFINLVEVVKENWSFGNGEMQYA